MQTLNIDTHFEANQTLFENIIDSNDWLKLKLTLYFNRKQDDRQMFSLPGMAEISVMPTENSKNSGVPTGNRIPPGNQAWAMTSEFYSRPSLEESLKFIF